MYFHHGSSFFFANVSSVACYLTSLFNPFVAGALADVPPTVELQSNEPSMGHQEPTLELPEQQNTIVPSNDRSGKNIDVVKACMGGQNDSTAQPLLAPPGDSNIKSTTGVQTSHDTMPSVVMDWIYHLMT